jgi:hypothetical protein
VDPVKTSLLDLLFGCWHTKYTFPIRKGANEYVCCLDCGKEFFYSWEKMKVISKDEARQNEIIFQLKAFKQQRDIDMAVERILAK